MNRYVLDKILDQTGMKGTGRWTVQEAAERSVPAPTIAAALDARWLDSFHYTSILFYSSEAFPLLPLSFLLSLYISSAFSDSWLVTLNLTLFYLLPSTLIAIILLQSNCTCKISVRSEGRADSGFPTSRGSICHSSGWNVYLIVSYHHFCLSCIPSFCNIIFSWLSTLDHGMKPALEMKATKLLYIQFFNYLAFLNTLQWRAAKS